MLGPALTATVHTNTVFVDHYLYEYLASLNNLHILATQSDLMDIYKHKHNLLTAKLLQTTKKKTNHI